MSPTKILVGQGCLVVSIVAGGLWASTQWTAAMLGNQPRLGAPLKSILGQPIYAPWRLFEWWYAYEAYLRNVVLVFSRPGKPTDNAFIESFNGKFRAECLNAHWFMSLDDARRKMEDWLKDNNEVRPHSSIGNKTPISLINHPGYSTPE